MANKEMGVIVARNKLTGALHYVTKPSNGGSYGLQLNLREAFHCSQEESATIINECRCEFYRDKNKYPGLGATIFTYQQGL